ncbi:MAG: hypothetical protein LWW86_04140 [Micrococcales bacterium]|nr:hypothetical protein [Micrococcales bacterium]
MSLTGAPLLALTAAAALCLFALCLALARIRWVLARASLLVALNVAVLLVAGLVVNRQYGLYTSWSDLLGPPAPA